jgi:hypothetical protein
MSPVKTDVHKPLCPNHNSRGYKSVSRNRIPGENGGSEACKIQPHGGSTGKPGTAAPGKRGKTRESQTEGTGSLGISCSIWLASYWCCGV